MFSALVRPADDHVAVGRVLGTPGTYNVVTDLGIRYPVPSGEALQMLGYAPDQAVEIPAALVARISQGPPLDPATAIQPSAITSPDQRPGA